MVDGGWWMVDGELNRKRLDASKQFVTYSLTHQLTYSPLTYSSLTYSPLAYSPFTYSPVLGRSNGDDLDKQL
jgi:hypothetical protein